MRARFGSLAFVALLGALTLTACAGDDKESALDRLHQCRSDEGPTDAYCGSLRVFEDRETRQGRTIDLRIIVLPALGNNPRPDPLFFLAGGPGQGAAELARPLREVLRRVQANRDIVLVDQRGTGKSSPLDCRGESESLRELDEESQAAVDRLRKCLEGYKADVRLYTTSIAMDDLDDVRAFLGYDKINLYGGSYGTRAALVYLRQHEPHVRSVVLDGVAPPDMRLPMFFARDAQRSLDLLLDNCAADPACQKRYPDLKARLAALMDRLDKAPPRVRVTHPRTGATDEVTMRPAFVAGAIFGSLYSPLASSLVPALIERAEKDDFQGLLALALSNEGLADNMSIGMQFSVLCAEDHPRIDQTEAARESANTIFKSHLLESRLKTCEFWPKGSVSPDFYKPVSSSVPVLLLSGELDPVTPPSWAEATMKSLSNSRHLVAPGTGHGVLGTGCGQRIISEFIERGDPNAVDAGCLNALKRPPFFLTPAGPDPTATSASAARP